MNILALINAKSAFRDKYGAEPTHLLLDFETAMSIPEMPTGIRMVDGLVVIEAEVPKPTVACIIAASK
ncbi:hypothetical protein CCP2SC5_740001 [Azospirillaceae bacterium]